LHMEPGDLIRREMSWFTGSDGTLWSRSPIPLFMTKLPGLPSGNNEVVARVSEQKYGMVVALLTIPVSRRDPDSELIEFALVLMQGTYGWVLSCELEVIT
jgi:hypothetical protein